MKNKIAIIKAHLEQVVHGEPAPPFMSPKFGDLMTALTATSGPAISEPFRQFVFESIGRQTVTLLLDRLQASMGAERTLSIMRGDNQTPM